jgi:hypothetical protein
MKIQLTGEKWNLLHQPSIGQKYYLFKKGKKVWFDIIEQGWIKTGVYLKLKKIKEL